VVAKDGNRTRSSGPYGMALAAKGRWQSQTIVFHSLEIVMIKTLMAVAVAGVFTLPMTASAGNDSMVVAQAGGNMDQVLGKKL